MLDLWESEDIPGLSMAWRVGGLRKQTRVHTLRTSEEELFLSLLDIKRRKPPANLSAVRPGRSHVTLATKDSRQDTLVSYPQPVIRLGSTDGDAQV